ncbi:SDR family NAD(P)-dependent oxidoreductase [Pyxidicoccus xibeiensis]|uniref:SDR family NAD(P)-dependent oxidoreductase n=1 Tax=Pyxidicoccus xibeiensis TaxID=2906759 RepID=UPI0020A8196A|nr:SDR family oxidoreductase [Pyxidicoccus xibeiensis]MCP3136590.1 SDR family oxidoreductase [Pyxidicoccus xibeiensis]
MKKFAQKVAVVTGGTSGIGLATAQQLAEEGAKVVVFARSEEGLAQAVKSLGPNAHGVRGDVTRVADLERLFQETRERFGGIDVLFANAAVVKLAPISGTSDALFDELVSVNLKGTFNTLRLAIPHLNAGASVVVTTSWLNRIGFEGSSVLSMTKAALRSLVRVAAAELAPKGIRVNAVCPGAFETPLWGKLGLPAEQLQATGASITAQIPLKRWGRAEELARAVLFLASPDSSYVTGTELEVDGGLRQV